MKHLKGYKQRYFSLAIIAMYSTLFKLCTIDANYQYYRYAFERPEYKISSPYLYTYYLLQIILTVLEDYKKCINYKN